MACSRTITLLLMAACLSAISAMGASLIGKMEEREPHTFEPAEIQSRFLDRAQKIFWNALSTANDLDASEADELRKIAAIGTNIEMVMYALQKNSADVARAQLFENQQRMIMLGDIPHSLVTERLVLRTLIDVKTSIANLWRDHLEPLAKDHAKIGAGNGPLTELARDLYAMRHYLWEDTEAAFRKQNDILYHTYLCDHADLDADQVLAKVDGLIDDAFQCPQCSSTGTADKNNYFTHPLYIGGQAQVNELIKSNVDANLVEAVNKIFTQD